MGKAKAGNEVAKVEANGKSGGHKTWSGALMVGPISIPVAMFAAGRGETVSFNMLHRDCGQKVKQAGYHCPCCVEVRVLADIKYQTAPELAAYNAALAKLSKSEEVPAGPAFVICKKGETVVMHQDDYNQFALTKKVELTGQKAMVEGDYIVKGFEVGNGEFVRLAKEEIDALKPESSGSIHIETFVPQSQVNPIYFESSYYLAADSAVQSKSYSVLREGLIQRKVAAVGKVCVRNSESVVFILPHPDGGLVAYTAYLADEIRQVKFQQLAPVSDAERDAVCGFIDAMTGDLAMEQYHDSYRENVMKLIEAKQEGRSLPVALPAPKPKQSDNLLEMLKASTAVAQANRKKRQGIAA